MTDVPQGNVQNNQGLDLSAMRNPRTATGQHSGAAQGHSQTGPASGTGPAGSGNTDPNSVQVPSLVFDVTEQTFDSVVQLSMQVPVVLDLWAQWCGPCKQLSPILDKVVTELAGKVVLAKVDVDANPQLQQVFQVQSIPTVIALVKGQPVPLFQGAQPEPQVRDIMNQLIAAAAQAGVTKTAVTSSEPPAPAGPKYPEAIAALEAGDLDNAAKIYRQALVEAPADTEAKQGLARVELLARTRSQDLGAVREAAANDPRNVDAALACADLDVAGGHIDDAFTRLIKTITLTGGDERERVRVRILELFDAVGSEDPRVVKSRGQLMRALF